MVLHPVHNRYGLPEVPGEVSDISCRNRQETYKRLYKLGTKPYDAREIIYYRGQLSQGELKDELRSYGYTIPSGDNHGTGSTLHILENVTNEIRRDGSKNATKITWVGAKNGDH